MKSPEFCPVAMEQCQHPVATFGQQNWAWDGPSMGRGALRVGSVPLVSKESAPDASWQTQNH